MSEKLEEATGCKIINADLIDQIILRATLSC